MDRYVVFDLETTGHAAQQGDRIIEVGMVVVEGEQITDTFSTLLNPHQDIPPFISQLTGVTNEDVADAPVFNDVAKKMTDLMKNSYLIAHNIEFDLGFLNAELKEIGLPTLNNAVLDTVELSRILFPQAPGYKLGQLADFLRLQHQDPHRALSDAYVTAELFLMLKEKMMRLPYETIHHLLALEPMFKSHLREILTQQEERLAFSLTDHHAYVTFRGLAFKKRSENEASKEGTHLSYGEFLDTIYEENGLLAQTIPHYEKRPGQRHMSEHIYDAFQSEQHALIEAETGTGKSLGYLLPAIYEAVKTSKRLVISTYTIQLQSQLLEEEIPLIKKILPFSFDTALLKGKRHYLSLEKFSRELESNQHDNYDIVLTKAIILIWLTETETGDIDEITLPSSGYYFYNKVLTDIESTVDPSSPWFKYSYYQKAREKAQKADIVVTNHALLCTDMFNDYSFIPSYEKVIIDEAHHLEDTASHHYGLKLDYVNIIYTLNQLGRMDEDGWFHRLITRHPIIKNYLSVKTWNTMLDDTRYEMDQLFRLLFQYVIEQKKNEKSLSDVGRIQYRFEHHQEDTKLWSSMIDMVHRVTYFLRDLIHFLSQINQQDILDKIDTDELLIFIDDFQEFIDSFEHLFIEEDTMEHVKWLEIEANGAKNAVYLYSEPTDISSILSNNFFEVKKSVILTSATLTMRQSFSFIEKRLGVPAEGLIKEKIVSPFSYDEQVQLLIPNDFPDIKYGKMDDYIYSVSEAILSLARITNGRMLVLFTSYDMLRKTYYLLKETMASNEYMLIAQGISSGSRTKLKKNFQSFDKAILLGTSSFWEGVDIPGEDLSSLVIARLPFQPPNHPTYEAKSKIIKSEGKSPFFELALPNAVLRFKQGFGRLIRSTEDRGIVFICDARIIKARYGNFFTQSIPDVPITVDTTKALINKAEKWF